MGERESFDITRELLGGSKRDFPANSLDFPVFARFCTYFRVFSRIFEQNVTWRTLPAAQNPVSERNFFFNGKISYVSESPVKVPLVPDRFYARKPRRELWRTKSGTKNPVICTKARQSWYAVVRAYALVSEKDLF